MIGRLLKQQPFLKVTSQVNHYILSVVIIGITALLCSPLSNTQGYHIVSFLLLFIVSILATFMGVGPILIASTLSALVWNYFFIPPHFTFHIDRTEDLLMFGMFFIIAMLNGILTSKVRKQERLAREREERTNALFQLTKELSKTNGISGVLKVAKSDIRKNFSLSPVFILQEDNDKLMSFDKLEPSGEILYKDYLMAEWIFQNGKGQENFETINYSGQYSFYILPGSQKPIGVLVINPERPFVGEQKKLWETFVGQISNALERELLTELAQKVSLLDESDKLYKTLFNSISHELRIPVATILGAADSLLSAEHPGNIQAALINEISTASIRLNRLIENLLNMSRLESGRISVRLDWYDVNDLVNKVLIELQNELKPFNLNIDIADNMPLVKIDFGLMEQVLYNLLYNATEQAPATSTIRLTISHKKEEMFISISDRGPGFSKESLKNVFKKFFRVNDHKPGGLGLGLSIVKGFVEAHHGNVEVDNRKNGGARFTIRIPSKIPDMAKLISQDE